MAIDTTSTRSRRALLIGAVGGAAAAVAASVTRVAPAVAATGGNFILGQLNGASSRTELITSHTGDRTFDVEGKSDPGRYVMRVKAKNDALIVTADRNGLRVDSIGDGDSTAVQANTFAGRGYALSTTGRIKVDRVSGVATIKKGKKSVIVDPDVDVNAKTFVLLTPNTNVGSRAIWYTKQPVKDTFTIRMSSARRGPTKIAWFALEKVG